MEDEYCLTRSSVNLRVEPRLTSSVLHGLGPQEPVQILEELSDVYKVEAFRWQPPMVGYVPRASIVRPRPPLSLFPRVDVRPDLSIPSVPLSLPLSAFLQWLSSRDESPWLPADYLDAIRLGKVPSVGRLIRQSIDDHRDAWNAWVNEVKEQGRQDLCTLDEWIALANGGREMWSIRTERIFEQPSEGAVAIGWVAPEDVVHWTGHVQYNPGETKYKLWYEVEFAKLERQLRGWYKADLLEEFFLPTASTDLTVSENRDKVFDLSKPRLRVPDDPEVEVSRKTRWPAVQYIDIQRAIGWGLVQHNLCGEFCVAALAGSDMIPLLQKWIPSYVPARKILENDWGTSLPDLQSMLDAVGMSYEFYRAETSVAPLTPAYLRKMLDTGRMAITFTGVTLGGVLKAHSRIRHWMVIEDILRVANSAWLRIYNPFTNREEVYRYEEVIDMPSRSSIGLWITPRLAGLSPRLPTVPTSPPSPQPHTPYHPTI